MTSDDFVDDPFGYPEGEEPEPIVHKVIGVCADCGDDAHVTAGDDSGDVVCFPCAYNRAN